MKISARSLSLLALAGMCALLCMCSSEEAHRQQVIRLDKVLAQYGTFGFDRQLEVFDSLRPEIDAMFSVLGIDYVTTATLDDWSRSQVVTVFQPAVDSVYADVTGLEQQIGYMLERAEADSLRLPPMRFATVTWGNARPMVRVDTVMLIALNHYLGPDYPGYEAWPQYRRAEKSPRQLPYDLAAALAATQYPMEVDHAPTLLDWMLYEGALVEVRMRLVKDADLATALGYTQEQYEAVEADTRKVWEEMALRKLVYDTDPTIIDRYIAAAPNTPLLQGAAPGRIGRYIGYKIVRAYLSKHPDTGLDQLLSPQFYGRQQTLIESGFNPR